MNVPHCGETLTHRPHDSCTGIPVKQPPQLGPTNLQVLAGFDSVRLDEHQLEHVEALREAFKALAIEILDIVPASADRTAALRELTRVGRDTVFAYTHNLKES